MTDVGSVERSLPDTDRPAPPRLTRRSLLERYGLVLVLAILVLVFSALRPETFPTYRNFTTIVTTQDLLVILAIGTMVPLIAGQFDLSIGAVLGFSGMIVAALITKTGLPMGLAIAAAILAAGLVGLLNGILVVHVRINAFIATLGMGSLLSGLTIWMSDGAVISEGLPEGLLSLAQTQVAQLPLTAFYMVAVIAVFYYLLHQTPIGHYLQAIGGGREAARLAGVPVDRLTILAFVLSGTVAGIAGVLSTAGAGAAHPDAGTELLLPAFAGAFLGATAITPGRFNVPGTVIAVFLLAVGIAGLQQVGAPFWVSPVFNGAALLVAVGVAVNRSRRIG